MQKLENSHPLVTFSHQTTLSNKQSSGSNKDKI